MAVLAAGGYAEYAAAPAGLVVRIPDGAGLTDGSALLVQGLTAYGVLPDSASVGEGAAVLVMATGGGVGTLAVQRPRSWRGPYRRRGRKPGEAGVFSSPSGQTAPWTTREGSGSRRSCRRPEAGASTWRSNASAETRAYKRLTPLGRPVTYGAAGGEGSRPPDKWQLNLKGQTVGGYGGPWILGGAQAPPPGPGKPSRVFSGTAA